MGSKRVKELQNQEELRLNWHDRSKKKRGVEREEKKSFSD